MGTSLLCRFHTTLNINNLSKKLAHFSMGQPNNNI